MPDAHPPRRQTLLRTSPRSFLRFLCNTRPSKFQPRNLTPPAPLSLSSTSEPLGLERPHLERSVGQPKEISELADDERSQSSSLTPAFDKSPFVGPTGKKTRPVGNASLLTKWCLTVFPRQALPANAKMQGEHAGRCPACGAPLRPPRPFSPPPAAGLGSSFLFTNRQEDKRPLIGRTGLNCGLDFPLRRV